MRHKILECAMGTVYVRVYNLDKGTRQEIWLWVPHKLDMIDKASNGHHFRGDEPLFGGKFTAREFLEAYLNAAKWAPVYPDCKNTQESMGTWHFTAEAVEMARLALEEWKK